MKKLPSKLMLIAACVISALCSDAQTLLNVLPVDPTNMPAWMQDIINNHELNGSIPTKLYVNDETVSQPCKQIVSTWFLGGNNINIPPTPPPPAVPATFGYDIGTCNNLSFILKANDRQTVFITPRAQVGIGPNNSNPTAALDVTDGGVFRTQIFGDGNGTILSTNNMNLDYTNGGGFYINEGTTASYATRLRIEDGIVAVGNPLATYSPHYATAKFTVKGKAVAEEIIVTLQSWSDFVFDNNYKLMPLKQLEAFYKDNHHLPNVPTARDVMENGNDLGKTDALLLQKIEELTLYIVELEKRLEKVEEK